MKRPLATPSSAGIGSPPEALRPVRSLAGAGGGASDPAPSRTSTPPTPSLAWAPGLDVCSSCCPDCPPLFPSGSALLKEAPIPCQPCLEIPLGLRSAPPQTPLSTSLFFLITVWKRSLECSSLSRKLTAPGLSPQSSLHLVPPP